MNDDAPRATDPLVHDLAGGPADPVDLDDALARFRAVAAAEGLLDVAFAPVDTPVGRLYPVRTEAGIVAIGWDRDAVLEQVAASVSPRVLEAPARLDDVRRQLDEYFEHRREHFDLPIDWSLTRGFRRDVLESLHALPYGEVISYAGLAARVGNPGATRAVGTAMAQNPLPIVVPCHRVLRSGGALGNYSGRNGVVTKRFLLEHEGALLPLT